MAYILENVKEAERLELQKKIQAYSIEEELKEVDLNYKNILDAGCGGGDVSHYLIANSINSKISGCDFSDIRVAHAKKKNPSGSFFKSSLEDIEAEDNSFDLIVCRYVFEYLPDPTKVLKEFKRVCKPGGEIIVIDIDGVFKNFHTSNLEFNNDLNHLVAQLKVDLDAGRKISSFFHLAGISQFDCSMSSFHFKGEELELEKENSEMRLNAIEPELLKAFGEKKSKEFSRNYLLLLEHRASVMFFNKFIVRGRV